MTLIGQTIHFSELRFTDQAQPGEQLQASLWCCIAFWEQNTAPWLTGVQKSTTVKECSMIPNVTASYTLLLDVMCF